jgi:3-oxoacyl-[acyl-carrier protein] reductase
MKCVMVTGGSRGLGLAIVAGLLRENYRVITCSRTCSKELEKLREKTDRLYWGSCTLGVESEETAFFDEAVKWLGESTLHALVNNAGIASEGILATFPNVETEKIIATNLVASIRMTRLALREMITKRTHGRIINISSIVGSRGYTGLAAYSASKAGLDGFTRSVAREVGRRNITVNSIAPGYLETEMSAALEGRQRQQIINRTPLGRLGQVDDVVPVVRFLLSDDAAFITGQTIIVDGGITS